MSEQLKQLPGYNIEQGKHGLLVAESYRNNAYTAENHPHPVDTFAQPEHVKTHGLVETTRMVGGKEIIVMQEYPGPAKATPSSTHKDAPKTKQIARDLIDELDLQDPAEFKFPPKSTEATKASADHKKASKAHNADAEADAAKLYNGFKEPAGAEADEVEGSAETINHNAVKLDVGHAEKISEGNFNTFADDELQFYGLADTNTTDSPAWKLKNGFNNIKDAAFDSPEQATNLMNQAMTSIGSAEAAVVKIEVINGETYVIAGNSSNNRITISSELGNITPLAHNVTAEYKKLNKNDRIMIVSANTTLIDYDIRSAAASNSPQEAADKLLARSPSGADKAAFMIDVEDGPGLGAAEPIPVSQPIVIKEKDLPPIDGYNPNPHLRPIKGDAAPEPDVDPQPVAQPTVIQNPDANSSEVVGKPKKLRLRDKAKLVGFNALMNMTTPEAKGGYTGRRKLAVAALGIVGMYAAYKGIDSVLDGNNAPSNPRGVDTTVGSGGSSAGAGSEQAPVGDGSSKGLKALTPDEIKEARRNP